MARETFDTWYGSLGQRERRTYARRAGTTTGYIESHLLAPYKIPRPGAMAKMAAASGRFTVGELAAWFYEAKLARDAALTARRAA